MRRRGRSVVLSLFVALALVAPIAVSKPAGATGTIFYPWWIPTRTSCVESQNPTTGQPDQSADLQSFFDQAATAGLGPGDTVQLAQGACYKTENTIRIHDLHGVVVDGNGSRFRSFTDALSYGTGTGAWPTSNSHVWIQGDTSTTIKNLRVLGNASGGYNANREKEHAFAIQGSNTGTKLVNDVADSIWGDYVFIQRGGSIGDWHVPTNVAIQNNRFGTNNSWGAGRHQLTIDDANGLDISGNIFGGQSGLDSIDIETLSTSQTVADVTVDSNTFGSGRVGLEGFWLAVAGNTAKISNL